MTPSTWKSVDDYIINALHPPDAALEQNLLKSAKAGLPEINVSAPLGKMLMLLAKSVNARSILEIGTLGGYSTTWLARALCEEGTLVTLEFEPRHAKVAEENMLAAGVFTKVQVMVGPAIDSLPKLDGDPRAPFDLIFIDADKESYSEYLTWCLRLSRSGTLIIADNVVRNGAVIEPDHEDSRVQGIRKFNQRLASESRIDATIIQTVGSKGYDGFALIYVK